MSATTAAHRPTTLRAHFLGLAGVIALGAAFLIASLPDATTLLANRTDWAWLGKAGEASAALKAALPPVASLLEWITYALAAYAGALVLVSLRHRQPVLIAWGLGIVAGSSFVLHGIAWVGVIAFTVGRFIARVVAVVVEFVFGIISWVLEKVYDYLISPFIGLFEPLLGELAWAGALAVVVAVLVIAHLADAGWAGVTAKFLGVAALLIGVVAGANWLIGLVPQSFWDALRSIGGSVLGFLIAVVVCAMVGQLFLDQIRSGAHAGSGRRGVVMGAIAIGSTLAILMLVGNVHDIYDLYPSTVSDWARSVVLSDAPKLDAAVTLLVVGICALGVLRNLVHLRPEPDPAEFRKSLVYTIMGVYVAGAVAALDKATSD